MLLQNYALKYIVVVDTPFHRYSKQLDKAFIYLLYILGFVFFFLYFVEIIMINNIKEFLKLWMLITHTVKAITNVGKFAKG